MAPEGQDVQMSRKSGLQFLDGSDWSEQILKSHVK
jgi:hypothetical protein